VSTLETGKYAAVFAGGGDSLLDKYAYKLLQEIKNGGRLAKSATEKINTLWATADIGALLTKEGWGVITGGYYMGPMGMASRSAFSISRKLSLPNKPIGAVFTNDYPDDPLTIQGQLVDVKNVSQRQEYYFKNASAFFFMGGGGLGTLNEIAGALKDDFHRAEISTNGRPRSETNLNLRPFIVVDPVGKTQELLYFIFNSYIGKEKYSRDKIILDILKRIFLINDDGFQLISNQEQYPGLMRLTEKGKKQITDILDHFTGITGQDLSSVPTFYNQIE
jgi:predicted Rossmann-fold nucleotide-binding protein